MQIAKSPRTFVTGGGSGLGRALALEFAKRNASLLIGDINLERAQETAEMVMGLGAKAEAVRCDVTALGDVEAAAETMQRLWGGTDVLVNNAGVAAGGLVGEIPMADWEWIMRVNFWGVLHGCHTFVPKMKAQGKGWILNVASSAGIASLPEMASYNVTKAAVVSLSETLYAEAAPHGVHVSVLCPTFFQTNLLEGSRFADTRQRKMAEAFFKRSNVTSETVAKKALEGMEAGDLVIIPQVDGRLVWAAKRLSHQLYFKAIAKGAGSKWIEKVLGV